MPLTTLAFALDDGDPPNPAPGLIPDGLWWLMQRQLELEPGTINAGIYANKAHFHNTVTANQLHWPSSYSIALPILLLGPHGVARADDWQFPEAQASPPDYTRINRYSERLLIASKAQDPRLRGWYEWFGTKDGANIGWGIYKNVPSKSDDTHDWHIHKSVITAYVLDWRTYHGMISVLMGETLEAFLARGGKVIGAPVIPTKGPAVFFIQALDHAPLVNKSDGANYEPVPGPEAEQAFNAGVKAGIPFVQVANMVQLEALAGKPGPLGSNLTMTPEQIVMLGNQIARGVLVPLADAAEVAANSLREDAAPPK